MNAIDRIMRAYLSTRSLTEDEASRVKAELAKFIDELMTGKVVLKRPHPPKLDNCAVISGINYSRNVVLFKEGSGLLVRRRPLRQFLFGLMPEFVFAPFRLSGLRPKLMCANFDLFFGRF
jgi:hypothetical protein